MNVILNIEVHGGRGIQPPCLNLTPFLKSLKYNESFSPPAVKYSHVTSLVHSMQAAMLTLLKSAVSHFYLMQGQCLRIFNVIFDGSKQSLGYDNYAIRVTWSHACIVQSNTCRKGFWIDCQWADVFAHREATSQVPYSHQAGWRSIVGTVCAGYVIACDCPVVHMMITNESNTPSTR